MIKNITKKDTKVYKVPMLDEWLCINIAQAVFVCFFFKQCSNFDVQV